MPKEQFPNKPVQEEQHKGDVAWVLEKLKTSIPSLNNKTSTEVIIKKLKVLIGNKPEEFYSSLAVAVRAQIK
ncbi:MAG: hypothetical protein ACKOW9_06070 [Candidatus Paceibacterota bacterium]